MENRLLFYKKSYIIVCDFYEKQEEVIHVQIVNLRDSNKKISLLGGCGLCLGHFDGVHMGHRALVEALKKMNAERKEKLPLGIMCFTTPPTKTLDKTPTPQLSTLAQKLSLLRECGLDFAVLYDFPAIKSMSPDDFIRQVLIIDCNAKMLVCGFNYSFGARGAGTPADLERYFATQPGRSLHVQPPVTMGRYTVSSSLVRTMLQDGHADDATKLLGRPYSLKGRVETGKQLGRTLGLPTANLAFSTDMLVPKYGVYAVTVRIGNRTFEGICNVGVRPTTDNDSAEANCETFIFEFDGDLYGKEIEVFFLRHMREEKKFSTLADLQAQIKSDIHTAKELIFPYLKDQMP